MSSDEIGYYRVRAAAERETARNSSNPVIAGIHEQMAELYESLIALEDHRPTLRIAVPSRSGSRDASAARAVNTAATRD